MKLYIIAGEASGDLHGSNLIKAIKSQQDCEIRAWGGDLMQAAGAELVKHYRDLAFMGFIEVLFNLRTILKNISFCKQDILEYKPDAIVLIDYPGFNLRIAEWAKKQGIKVYYYISPQIWAWKQSRVHKIKRDVDQMYVILPFEQDFYKKFDYEVEFVGHPLLDAIEQFNEGKSSFDSFIKEHNLIDKPIIALLPGSRKQEISTMLPIMLSIQKHYPEYQFVIAGAPSQSASFYDQFLKNESINIISNKTYDLLQHSHAALVTSGTATLETALFEVPEVVCYKGNAISYQIAKQLVKINYISLVNLIVDKEIVKELIQNELNEKNLKIELDKLVKNQSTRAQLLEEYKELKQKLGGSGASQNTASHLLKTLTINS